MAERSLGLFVLEDGEATVFWSFDEASRALAAADVRAGRYAIYTVDGRVVTATADRDRVELAVTARQALDELVERLRPICAESGLELARDDLSGLARELYRRDW